MLTRLTTFPLCLLLIEFVNSLTEENIFGTDCLTLDSDSDLSAKTGLPCIIPFKYSNKIFHGCTQLHDSRPWCATRLDEEGNYVNHSNDYGHCNSNCPLHEDSTDDTSYRDSLPEKDCSEGYDCVPYSSCEDFLKKKEDVEQLLERRPSLATGALQSLRSQVCSNRENKVCCKTEQELLRFECDSSEECVPRSNCTLIQELWEQQNIPEIKSRRCQEDGQEFCCPRDRIASNEPVETLPPTSTDSPNYLPSLTSGECTIEDSAFIIGGKTPKPGKYPSSALLGKYITTLKKHPYIPNKTVEQKILVYFCGGTLINKWYVLTAAHCNKDGITVVLGEFDTKVDPDCSPMDPSICLPKVQMFDIEKGGKFIGHEGFNTREKVNDIGLIRLPRMAQYSGHVRPACLPIDLSGSVSQFIGVSDLMGGLVGTRPHVVGWGVNDTDTLTQSTVLQFLDIPVLTADTCSERGLPHPLLESQICAGGETGKDSCHGDSGGPLYMSRWDSVADRISDESPVWFVIGIVSYGPRKCTSTPAVYTRVQSFLPWIKRIISQ